MKRLALIAAAAVLLLMAAFGVGGYLGARHSAEFPQISAFTKGELSTPGPFVYCDPLFTECFDPQDSGSLDVDPSNVVQLSVPDEIGKHLWRLLLVHEDGAIEAIFRPGERSAVTIATVDPNQGKLQRIVVQLPTIVLVDGEEAETFHAEWSVAVNWAD